MAQSLTGRIVLCHILLEGRDAAVQYRRPETKKISWGLSVQRYQSCGKLPESLPAVVSSNCRVNQWWLLLTLAADVRRPGAGVVAPGEHAIETLVSSLQDLRKMLEDVPDDACLGCDTDDARMAQLAADGVLTTTQLLHALQVTVKPLAPSVRVAH